VQAVIAPVAIGASIGRRSLGKLASRRRYVQQEWQR
jgi:hypothetical protein